MEIKFKKKLSDYKYLVMFDLASRVSGVCVFDLAKQEPLFTRVIKVDGSIVEELPAAELKQQIDNFFLDLIHREIPLSDIVVSKECMPMQVHGSSTINTFVALARSHAILDVYCYEHAIDVYDYTGVYPASTHAYYKKLLDCDKETKVTKEMIRDYLYQIYPNLKELTLDESDAVFLAKTLYDIKINHDIEERIRQIKRHRKTLKSESAIKKLNEQIEVLNSLKTTN